MKVWGSVMYATYSPIALNKYNCVYKEKIEWFKSGKYAQFTDQE